VVPFVSGLEKVVALPLPKAMLVQESPATGLTPVVPAPSPALPGYEPALSADPEKTAACRFVIALFGSLNDEKLIAEPLAPPVGPV
jgi:hypothetical protein